MRLQKVEVGMPEISSEDRKRLRRTLKWSLRCDPWRRTESGGVVKDWYNRKLDGLLACGLARDKLSKREVKIMRWHFERGLPLDKIAFELKLSIRQVSRDLNRALDTIIDNVPQGIIVSLNPAAYEWILRGCLHCHGDMYWDEEGAHNQGGEYCCILCGHRYTIEEIEDNLMRVRSN
jgi:hypothetical protein